MLPSTPDNHELDIRLSVHEAECAAAWKAQAETNARLLAALEANTKALAELSDTVKVSKGTLKLVGITIAVLSSLAGIGGFLYSIFHPR